MAAADPASDPGSELVALASGLRHHLRRAARRGWSRVERAAPAPTPSGKSGASASPGAARAAAARPYATRAGPPGERPRTPPAPTTGAAGGPRMDGGGAPPSPPSPPAAAGRAEPSPAAPAPQPPDGSPAPWPSGWGDTPERKDEADRRAAEIRARAAAAPDLEALRAEVAGCNACGLCRTRTQTVFLDGDAPARVMFVGEAPGFHEDRQGVPFVGRAGQLLSDIVTKGMGLERSEVAIGNILKCRPPENRDPTTTEKRLCTGWLDRQIELVGPEVLIALGRHAAGHLLASDAAIGRLRGRVWERDGRKVVATYHPAFLLRSPQFKKDCWQDVQLAMRELGLRPPARG